MGFPLTGFNKIYWYIMSTKILRITNISNLNANYHFTHLNIKNSIGCV